MSRELERFHRFYPRDYPAASQPRSGQGSPAIKKIRVDLSTARDDAKMSASGSVLWAYRASSLAAQLDIKLNEQSNDDLTFQRGTLISGYKFSEFYMTNTAQAGEWIDLIVTTVGAYGFDALNPDVSYAEIDLVKQTEIETTADVTVTAAAAAAVVLAADADRKEAIIQSLPSNTQNVRIGDGDTGAARGLILKPGDSIVLTVTAAVYAYTAAGADQDLAIVEIKD